MSGGLDPQCTDYNRNHCSRCYAEDGKDCIAIYMLFSRAANQPITTKAQNQVVYDASSIAYVIPRAQAPALCWLCCNCG